MSKKIRARSTSEPAPPAPVSPPRDRRWLWPAIMVAAVLAFYWVPLTSPNASIQWDAVDVHYSPQKYFAERVAHGELPHWTPYLFSGFPFLADPQVGAWYPPNWPFFLIGITPRAIEGELALHALIALSGAFLLFERRVANRPAAMSGAFLYAFSGYFAEHSSHVGMFSTAAVFPWLLYCFDRAMESNALRNTVCAGLAGGVMILAGHFQTALYAFIALVLFAAGRLVASKAQTARAVAVLAGTGLIAVLLASIQTLPGLQLSGHSLRALADYSREPGSVLRVSGLATLLIPNTTNPSSTTEQQFYLYAGILLIPLAALGAWRNAGLRIPALLLILIPTWYMLGPSAGLYRAAALIPGLRSVRAPIHFWFVPALALAMLAAAGAVWLFARWRFGWLPAVLLAVVFVDAFYWNLLENPAAFARSSFAELYGNREQLAAEKVAATQPPLTRFDLPPLLTVFGPLNHPLDLKLEAAYGYSPLELTGYSQYRAAMQNDPRLRSGLNISRWLDTRTGTLGVDAAVLPRAYFAKRVVSAPDTAAGLATLDPAESAVVAGSAPPAQSDPQAIATFVPEGEQAFRVRYRAVAPGLIKISVPYYPGWQATIDGSAVEILRVDHALMGVAAAPGEKEIAFRFRSTRFAAGASISLLTLAACAVALVLIPSSASKDGPPRG